MNILKSITILSLFYLPVSFAQIDEQKIIESKKAYIQPLYKKLFEQGNRNSVLNYMEIGSLAFKSGDLKEAKIAFDNAVRGIEYIYKDNPASEKARSLWYAESEKDFKGEPYERVMAYYYLGLIYLAEGDIENARAVFISGLLQDAFAEEKQNRADFAIMMYLSAWSAMKMNAEHLWSTSIERFAELRAGYPLPKPKDNVLVIVETGKSPRKLADGIGKYELVYRRGKKFKDTQASIKINNDEIRLLPAEDIYWQASTRGGRNIDRIIKGKVEFSDRTSSVGDTLAKTGNTIVEWSALNQSSDSLKEVGTAMSVIGLASKMLSLNVETRADTRYWKSLPNTVHIQSLKVKNINDISNVTVNALDKYGNVLNMAKMKTNVYRVAGKYTIIWAKSH